MVAARVGDQNRQDSSWIRTDRGWVLKDRYLPLEQPGAKIAAVHWRNFASTGRRDPSD